MTCIHRTADQVIGGVPAQVRPIGEAGLRLGCAIRAAVFQVAVGGGRHAVAGRIDAGKDGDDVVGGVRDERRVMIGKERAILLDEVEQVRHLLKVGRYQGRAIACGVALEVRIVEDDGDYVADLPARRVELASSGRTGSRRCRSRRCELRSCACSRGGHAGATGDKAEEYRGSQCNGLAVPRGPST